ncbi:MAG: ATP-binding protein [Synergistaceae bacterium]
MAIQLKTTADLSMNGLKVLVYGPAGVGKTTLIKTLPNPIILSAEGGLLSLQSEDLPYIEIKTMQDLNEAYLWLTLSDEAKQFQSVALDSISEIAEVVLGTEKAQSKDPRQAYGAMQDQMTLLIRSFRDLPGRHVYFSAKVEKQQNELGQLLHSPAMPGQKLGQMLPYFFDEVLALRVAQNENGEIQRMLMCQSDGIWTSKDRSGKLDMWEAANLNNLIEKIGGNVNGQDIPTN